MALLILVAEDDPGTRLAISDYLEHVGYSVVAAANGAEALTMMDEYQPHLVVTDVMMPQIDGYELVRRLRQRPTFRLLPVVFLTARNQTEERIHGYKLGCDAYLSKPFELAELGAVVRNLLERSQLIQSEWLLRPRVTAPSEDPQDRREMMAEFSGQTTTVELSQREQEVLHLLLDGLSNGQIGDRLHLSSRTVEKYVSSLLRKTDTNNRAELVRFALEHRMGQG